MARSFAAALAAFAGLAVAGCGPHVDVSVPVVTTLARGALRTRPLEVCNAAAPVDPTSATAPVPRRVTVVGTGFLPQAFDELAVEPRVVVPQVSVHGAAADLTLANTAVSYRDPTALDLLVPVGGGALPLGLYDVTVKNPEGTSSTLAGALQLVGPPFVQSVAPASICPTQVQRIVVTGGVFTADAPPAAAFDSVPLAASSVQVDSPTQLTLTVPANIIAAGSTSAIIDLTDADGCTLSPSASIAVGSTCAP